MFALVLTLITPQVVNGDTISVDMENGGSDVSVLFDDEVHETTNSKVCAWLDGEYSSRQCQSGMKRESQHWGTLDFPDGSLDEKKDLYVQIYGSDALWVDRFLVRGFSIYGRHKWERYYGESNSHGWCLSTDRNDHLDWNSDDLSQSVPDNQCYYQVKLSPDGNVYGSVSAQALMCRVDKKMDCKQNCERGWKHISTSDDGCCKAFFDCGGTRKTCRKDYECRRRFENADKDVTVQVLPQAEEDGQWVLLSGQKADNVTRFDLADRLTQAELHEEKLQVAEVAVTDEATETAALQG